MTKEADRRGRPGAGQLAHLAVLCGLTTALVGVPMAVLADRGVVLDGALSVVPPVFAGAFLVAWADTRRYLGPDADAATILQLWGLVALVSASLAGLAVVVLAAV